MPAFQLLYQLSRIIKDRGALAHDERIDPVAMAVAYWVEYLSNDTRKAEQEEKQKIAEGDLQRLMKHVVFSASMMGINKEANHQNCMGLSRG